MRYKEEVNLKNLTEKEIQETYARGKQRTLNAIEDLKLAIESGELESINGFLYFTGKGINSRLGSRFSNMYAVGQPGEIIDSLVEAMVEQVKENSEDDVTPLLAIMERVLEGWNKAKASGFKTHEKGDKDILDALKELEETLAKLTGKGK